jgi:folate-binding protein YgfZ
VSRSAFELLLYGGAQAPLGGWRVVAVEGRHRRRFLQSQLTSDLEALAPGGSQTTALIDRAGRLQAFGFLLARGERLELLLPGAVAESALELLESHVISDDVSFRFLDTPRMRLVLGAEAVRLLPEIPPETCFPIQAWASRGFVAWREVEIDLPVLEESELETLQVLSGLPSWGVDAAPGTPIHETTLVRTAVSFDKGCYLGQETVAKVASGRGAAKAPMLLEVLDGDSPELDHLVGNRFAAGSREKAGEVLARVDWEGASYLHVLLYRDLRVEGLELRCRFADDSTLAVRVRGLPLIETPQPDEWARKLELRAVEEFARDREESAMRLLERAIAVCPSYADAYESLGVVLGRHRRFDEAIELMKRLLEVDPLSVMAHTNLSLYYNQLGRIDDAEREAAEAMRAGMRLKSEERDRSSSEDRASDIAAEDRERRAEMFRQVLELDPEDALGNFGLGELMVEEGRYVDAVEHLERALAADPRYSAAILALGRAHEGVGDLGLARETYRRGVAIAAAKGDLATANKMQERLVGLDENEE